MKPQQQTTPEMRAANVLAPYSDGTNNSNVLGFAVAASACALMPEDWEGCYVTCKAVGGDVYWFFSNQGVTGPNGALATAADGGADPARGWPVLDGESMDCIVPRSEPDERIYFCSVSTGADMFFRKSSPG